MGELLQNVIFGGVGKLFMLFWIVPAVVIAAVYLIYIIVMIIKERKKK